MSLTREFLKDPTKFLQKHAFSPNDDINSQRGVPGKNFQTINTAGFVPNGAVTPGQTVPASIGYNKMPQNQRVGYIKLKASDASPIGRGVVYFDCSYNQASVSKSEPVYFLPWLTGHAIRLTIPPQGVNMPDPAVFVTAAISGCSVFIQGPATNPTIIHAGAVLNLTSPDDGARFWQEAMQTYQATSVSGNARGAFQGQVNKTNYVTEPGMTKNNSPRTGRALAYEAWLQQKLNKNGKFSIEDVFPWGCVIGVRTGPDWAFYLQENATVVCKALNKTGTMEQRTYARPMRITRVFPNPGAAQAHVCMRKVPTKIS